MKERWKISFIHVHKTQVSGKQYSIEKNGYQNVLWHFDIYLILNLKSISIRCITIESGKKLSKNDAVNNILPGCGCSGIPWVPPDRALIVCWLRIPPGAPVWGTIEICREEPTREMSQSKPYILLTLSTSKSCKVSHWFTMLQLMSLLGILSTVLNTINYYLFW